MDKVQKTAFRDYNAPSSEPFRLNLNDSMLDGAIMQCQITPEHTTF
jgi:hypothetical protein